MLLLKSKCYKTGTFLDTLISVIVNLRTQNREKRGRKQEKKVLDKSIKKFPKEFASFLKLLKTKSESNDCITLTYSTVNEDEKKITQDFEKIKKALPPKFTFEDVLKVAIANHCILDLTKTIYNTCCIPNYRYVYLGYTLSDFSGKRVLFHDFDYEE